MASALSQRPTYSDDQLSTYLSLLFPQSHPLHNLAAFKDKLAIDPVATLSTLQKYHLGTIPWGDVGLHYSTSKLLSLDAQQVFEKLVVAKLGGYCMEVNTFYATVLRSLGVKLYVTGGRISNAIDAPGKRDPEGFAGWEHMVILATLNSKTYHIDVGFANFGTLSPMPLEEGASVNCVPGLKARLVRRSIPDNVTGQKLWILETEDSHSQVWKPGYCFGETEFLPLDFVSLNFRTMRDPSSWFTTTFILTKVLLSDNSVDGKDKEAIGTLTMIASTLQRRVDGGESEVILVCKSEAERIDALAKWFNVILTAEQQGAIKGTPSEIMEQAT